jgi:hypothetical protein
MFLLVASAVRTFAACPEDISAQRFQAQLELAEGRFLAMDGAVFSVAMDEASFMVPCLTELVTPALASQYHRLQGLNLFMSRNEERAKAAFAAARAANPQAELPLELVPEGHAIRELWATADPSGPSVRIGAPVTGYLSFDGETGDRRPQTRPTLLQVVSGEHTPTASVWLEPGDPLPAYESIPLPVARDQQDQRFSLPRVPLLAGSGAAALLGGVLYGVAATRAARFEGPKPADMTLDDLRGSQRATNTMVVGSVVAGGVSALTLGAAVVVGRW